MPWNVTPRVRRSPTDATLRGWAPAASTHTPGYPERRSVVRPCAPSAAMIDCLEAPHQLAARRHRRRRGRRSDTPRPARARGTSPCRRARPARAARRWCARRRPPTARCGVPHVITGSCSSSSSTSSIAPASRAARRARCNRAVSTYSARPRRQVRTGRAVPGEGGIDVHRLASYTRTSNGPPGAAATSPGGHAAMRGGLASGVHRPGDTGGKPLDRGSPLRGTRCPEAAHPMPRPAPAPGPRAVVPGVVEGKVERPTAPSSVEAYYAPTQGKRASSCCASCTS